MKQTRKKIAFTLLAIGACLLATSTIVVNWYKWEPVSFPIDLHVGQLESPSFRVNRSTHYLIELEAERALPFEQLNCLLGIDPGLPDPCKETPSPIDLKWSVASSDKSIAEGTSDQEHSGAWGGTINRTIGRFEGEKGKEYRLKIESLKDASVLAPAKPKIIVRVHPIEAKSYNVIAQAVLWVGLAVGIIGLILLMRKSLT
jgi:hypothetical protein